MKATYVAWSKIVLFLLALYFGEVSNVACLIQERYIPRGPNSLHGIGEVYFVPIGTFPQDVLNRLVNYYQDKYGLSISVLSPPLPALVARAFNEEREQYVAEDMVAILGQARVASDLSSTLIALTDQDLYIRDSTWRYAFGYRSNQLAVISSARIGTRFMAVWPIDSEWKEKRLRKMVTKYIAVLHYRLPLSSNCRSPLFDKIGGPQELDFMEEDL